MVSSWTCHQADLQLLRIRSPAGTSRLTVQPMTTGEDFAQMLLDTLPKSAGERPDEETLRLSNQPGPKGEQLPLSALVGRTIADMAFKSVHFSWPESKLTCSHGDMLFLSYKPKETDPSSHPTTEASTSHNHPSQPDPSHPHTHTDPPLPNTIPLKDLSNVQEPEVDVYWKSQKGKIERQRDPAFCRHGEKGMCDYCMPIEVSRSSDNPHLFG